MLTYDQWLGKFPQFVGVTEPLWDDLFIEASLEMGTDVDRWLGQPTYDVAIGYLLSHLAYMSERWESGDGSTIQPLRSKEVDDVVVEYAVSREMQNKLDPYISTVYGQQYIKWRRMVFAGPRVV